MGLISKFKGLFKTSKSIDDVLDKENGHLAKFGGWIGNMSYTEEDKAEGMAKLRESVQKFAVDTLAENTDRSKTRREVAVFVIKFYCVCLFMSGVTYPIESGWSAVWLTISTSVGLVGLVSGVGIFFFGTHAMRSYQNKKSEDKK